MVRKMGVTGGYDGTLEAFNLSTEHRTWRNRELIIHNSDE
jgi:hypothetical protein